MAAAATEPDVQPVKRSRSIELLPPHMSEERRLPHRSLSLVHGGSGLRQSIVEHEEPDTQLVTHSSSFEFLPSNKPDGKPVTLSSIFGFLPSSMYKLMSRLISEFLRLLHRSLSLVHGGPGLRQSIVEPEVSEVHKLQRRSLSLSPRGPGLRQSIFEHEGEEKEENN